MRDDSKYRRVYFYETHFQAFFALQNKRVRAKIAWTLQLIEALEFVPERFLKHVEQTDGLFEIRVNSGRNAVRIFCFFDYGKLIVVANAFHKKTQKTPRNQIEFAQKLKNKYETEHHGTSKP